MVGTDSEEVQPQPPLRPELEPIGISTGGGFSAEFDELFDSEDTTPRFGLFGYSVLYFQGIATWSCVTVLLWSSVFFASGSPSHPLTFLQDHYPLSKVLFGTSFGLLVGLYLLDFFMPPHLPGQYGALWDQDRIVGRAILVIAALLFVAGCFFLALYYPNLPMLVFVLLCSGIPYGIRMLTRPKQVRGRAPTTIECADLNTKVNMLKSIVGQAEDVLNFYKAVAAGFLATSAILIVAWIIMVAWGDVCFQECETAQDGYSHDTVFNQAICPLVVAFADLVFGLIASMRVAMHHTYMGTDRSRNLLASSLRADPAALEQRRIELKERLSVRSSTSGVQHEAQDITVEYLNQEQKGMKQLTMLVKVVGGAFVALIGMSYAGLLLIFANSGIASLFMGVLVVMFLCFSIVAFASFSRIVRVLGAWLLNLPIWTSIMNIMTNDWTRAFLFSLTLPLLLLVACLSMLNQSVRKLRGISGVVSKMGSACQSEKNSGIGECECRAPNPAIEALKFVMQALSESELLPEDERQFCLTARVHVAFEMARRLQWLSIYNKSYIWCILPFAYYVGSLIFNAAFSMLVHVLSGIPFYLVLFFTFVVGVVAFLWPTIPGMVVYMFGGLLVPGTCPFPAGDAEKQFWVGAGINMALGWLLKLAACAVQQKCIGEQLGRRLTVRHMCGVHTPQMRTIESVLRKPGLSVGKVAILCGAPDWPVSVLCGILGLSLLQCEIGTMPIILYIIPCSLCGSMYLKASDGAGWEKAAGIMVFLTTIVTGLLWIIIAWVIHREYEQNSEALSRPLREHADLFWLDHKAEEVRRRCVVSWSELPRLLRNAFALGALVQILVSHVFFMFYNNLFGGFSVSEDWAQIVWYGNSVDDANCYTPSGVVERDYCVFAAAGIAVTVLYILGWVPYHALNRHLNKKNAQIMADLDTKFSEEVGKQWMIDWIQEKVDVPDVSTHPSKTGADGELVEASGDSVPPLTADERPLPVARSLFPRAQLPSLLHRSELRSAGASSVGPRVESKKSSFSQHSDDLVRGQSSVLSSDWALAFCFLCRNPATNSSSFCVDASENS